MLPNPNLAARIFSPSSFLPVFRDTNGGIIIPSRQFGGSTTLWWRPRPAATHAAASDDIFTVGQSIFSAGSQALEKASRLFQPAPEGFPAGPRGDVALRLLADPLLFLEETQASHGDVVGMLLGGERVVLVSDPLVAEEVLVSKNAAVAKEGTAFFPGSKLAGNGLLVSDGALWQRQRQLSNPAFRKAAVDSYLQAMKAGAEDLVDRAWAGGGAREVYADFNALTLQIVTGALFGFQTSSPDSRSVTEAVRVAMDYFAGRAATGFAIPEWLPTPDNVQYNRAVAQLDEVVFSIIRQRRASGGSNDSRQCLLDNLLAARDEAGCGMSEQELRDELMTLLIAGQETSAIVLAWSCALLAHHPAQQAAATEELRRELGGERPAADNLGQLHFLEAVVLESMRLLPPAYLVGRCTTRSLELEGSTVPEGTTLLVSPYLMHRDGRKWPRSKEFLPQRWLPHLQGRKPGAYMSLLSNLGPNGAYLPFGAGPRNCIGNYFAMSEAVLVLSHVLQRYELRPLPGQKFPAANAKITLRPTAVPLAVEHRRGNS